MNDRVTSADNHTPLFDPGGVFWRVNREAVLLLGGGAALLMQIAHPLVAAGVYEHSGFREQPVRRLYGTVTAMQRMIYGDRASALETARRINEIHRRVHGFLDTGTSVFPKGTRYDARNPDLLVWVHSTLIATGLETYETFFPALEASERDAYYEESKTIAHLLGVTSAHLPGNWREFRDYYEAMIASDTLEVTPVSRQLARHIIHPPLSWVPGIAGDVMSVVTAALLPGSIRTQYDLPWTERRRKAWHFARRALRRTLPYMPQTIRTGPRLRRFERTIARQQDTFADPGARDDNRRRIN